MLPVRNRDEYHQGLTWLQGKWKNAVYALASNSSHLLPALNLERFNEVDYFNIQNMNYLAFLAEVPPDIYMTPQEAYVDNQRSYMYYPDFLVDYMPKLDFKEEGYKISFTMSDIMSAR